MRLSSRRYGIFMLLVATFSAGGCAFLIPDNPSTPRYNSVIGERRVPKENMGMLKNGGAPAMSPGMPMTAPEPMVQATPLPPVAAAPSTGAPEPIMALPPVDAQTQRIADARLADEARQQGRSVPAENMQLASSDYPILSDVPPAPPVSGDASAAERLGNVRRELEQQRVVSEQAKTQLERDAAAEPSMLSDLPSPASSAAPTPTPTMNVPASPVHRGIADLPPPPPLSAAPAPVPAMVPGAGAQAPIPMDQLPMGQAAPPPASAPIALTAVPPPMQTAALAPIQLRPPGSAGQGFDPISANGSSPRTMSYAASQPVGNFLPTSRYAYRR